MVTPEASDITRWLQDYAAGDREALNRLTPLVYSELRMLAERALCRERRDLTLSATALVHEAYLRMVDQRKVEWKHRAHFVGVAAQMMRRILVDHARGHVAAKRGGGARRVALDDSSVVAQGESVDLTELDEALVQLGKLDARQARIVELRFFAGLSIDETAEVLEISVATVKREWAVARAWLHRCVHGDRGTRPSPEPQID